MNRLGLKCLLCSWRKILCMGVLASLVVLVGCKAEVGSERWCKELKEELDEKLTLDGSKDYAKHCLFK